MGSCCTSDRGLFTTSDDNEKLILENLLLLKAFAIHYVDKKEHAMSVRIFNIRDITKEYYKTSSEQRKIALLNKTTFEENDLKHLESGLRQENQDLVRANQALKHHFSKARPKLMFFSVSAQDFLNEFKSDRTKMNDYRELREQCKRYERNGEGLLSLARILNDGKDLDQLHDLILTDLSQFTSHIARNPHRRVSFPSPVQFRTRYRNSVMCQSNNLRSYHVFDESRAELSQRNGQFR